MVEKTTEERRTDENVIYVGRKPPMNYVLAVVTQFNSGSDEVIIKARGINKYGSRYCGNCEKQVCH